MAKLVERAHSNNMNAAKEAAKKKVLAAAAGRSSNSGSTNKSASFVEKYFSSSPTLYYAIATAILVYAYFAFFSSSASIKNYVNANHETIKGLLTGETPYLFYCHNFGGKLTPPELLTDLSNKLGSKYSYGALNCSQTLPSGKTIYDRLKLRRDWKPVIFGSAPWKKQPMQASKEYLKDSKSLLTFVDKFLAPKALHIDTDNDLKRICGFGKKKKSRNEEEEEEEESEMSSIKNTCLVLIKGAQHSKKHAELEEKLLRHMPRAKIGIVDASKKRLSFEDVEDQPADSFSLQVYALREGTHYLPMTNAVTWDYLSTFVSYAFAQPLSAYSVPQAGGRAIKVVKVSSAFRDRSSSSSKARSSSSSSRGGSKSKSGKKKPSSSPSTKPASSKKAPPSKVSSAGSAETDPRAEAERDRRRREEMDRQSERHHVQEEDDEEDEDEEDEEEVGGESASDSDDDGNEDVIEL